MNTGDNDSLHAAINAKLAAVVETSSTMPGWHDAWTELGPESTEEERLAVYQAIRDSGCLPPDAGFYLVCWQIDAMVWQSLGFLSGEGPHVSIEGVYQGHEVFIQVLAYAPEDEEPGMKLDTT